MMFCRFAAATAIASAALGIATLVVLVVPGVPLDRFAPVLLLWCMMPLVWGLWAILAPRAWVPQRLPVWGAILGVLPAALALLILNLPSRVSGVDLPVSYRTLGVVLLVLLYYLLWMLVRVSYRALSKK